MDRALTVHTAPEARIWHLLHFLNILFTSRLVDPQVQGFTGAENLKGALEGADLVIIPAGVPRKPGMTRDDLFNVNAGIVQTLVQAVAETCPKVSRSTNKRS